jgi:hypothetical protein
VARACFSHAVSLSSSGLRTETVQMCVCVCVCTCVQMWNMALRRVLCSMGPVPISSSRSEDDLLCSLVLLM